MQGFVCGTVKIFSAFISKALVRPELWKNLATLCCASPIWTTLEPTTWTPTKPEMKLGVLQKITPWSAYRHTRTHRSVSSSVRSETHICVCPCPRHGSCILLFLSLSVLSLIWFPLGKTSLAWWDLIWPACHSYFSFFSYPDCLVNLPADGLVGCWKDGWQAEKLPGWMMSDSRWMNDWRRGSCRLRLMKSFFYLLNQGKTPYSHYVPGRTVTPPAVNFLAVSLLQSIPPNL